MKKIILLFSCLLVIKCASAQVVLSGTSYTQDFNGLPGDTVSPNWLPAGWSVRDSAVDDGVGNYFLGNDASLVNQFAVIGLTHKPAFWLYTSGKFRDFASADGIPFFGTMDQDGVIAGQDTTGFQYVATNRALGVRQVANTSMAFPASDPGAAFCFNIANTTGLTDFKLSFELQSLDSIQSSRISTWYVDYGFGAVPATYALANTNPQTLTTGGHTYSNTTVTVDFGNALDNKSEPVWIRIAALTPSTQTGDRPTTAIDNYNLTWTGNAQGVNNIEAQQFPLEVVATTSNSITVDFSLQHGSPVIASVYDITGREIFTGNYNCINGQNKVTVTTSEELAPGMYFIKLSNKENYGVAKAIIAK